METVLSIVALACSALALLRNPPEVLARKVERAEAVVDTVVAEFNSQKVGMARYLEELEDLAETIETRRKRAAASASRAEKAANGQQQIDPNDPMALTRMARAAGHDV